MSGFHVTDQGLAAQFEVMEVELLLSLARQLSEMIREDSVFGGAPAARPEPGADPFEHWESQFSQDEEPSDDADPVIQRLFPDAYPTDPAASAEFRRLSQPTQRESKLAAIDVVVADLESAGPSGRFPLPDAHVTPWLTTLNNLRLSVSVRLGITDEDSYAEAAERPEHDPRSFLFAIFGWLGMVLQDLVEILDEV